MLSADAASFADNSRPASSQSTSQLVPSGGKANRLKYGTALKEARVQVVALRDMLELRDKMEAVFPTVPPKVPSALKVKSGGVERH
jgi:hypothetical protein